LENLCLQIRSKKYFWEVKTENNIFIIEFKINQSAQKAIKQIKDKNYVEKYTNDKRKIILIGINFDTEKKRVDDYVVE